MASRDIPSPERQALRELCYETEGKTGLLILMNEEENRKGSEIDTENLKDFFIQCLGFEMIDMRQSPSRSVMAFLKEVKEKAIHEKEKYYCLMFCIGCHGDKTRIFINDEAIKFEDIKKVFNNKNLTEYEGRPKIFLAQFCRGGQKEARGALKTDSFTSKNIGDLIGNESSDIYVAYSTAKGKVSYRDTEEGSILIRICVDTFRQHWQSEHLHDMMTIVTRKVVGWTGKDEDGNCYQTVVVETSLTKKLHFKARQELDINKQSKDESDCKSYCHTDAYHSYDQSSYRDKPKSLNQYFRDKEERCRLIIQRIFYPQDDLKKVEQHGPIDLK